MFPSCPADGCLFSPSSEGSESLSEMVKFAAIVTSGGKYHSKHERAKKKPNVFLTFFACLISKPRNDKD